MLKGQKCNLEPCKKNFLTCEISVNFFFAYNKKISFYTLANLQENFVEIPEKFSTVFDK